jgi:hypothetical protein
MKNEQSSESIIDKMSILDIKTTINIHDLENEDCVSDMEKESTDSEESELNEQATLLPLLTRVSSVTPSLFLKELDVLYFPNVDEEAGPLPKRIVGKLRWKISPKGPRVVKGDFILFSSVTKSRIYFNFKGIKVCWILGKVCCIFKV